LAGVGRFVNGRYVELRLLDVPKRGLGEVSTEELRRKGLLEEVWFDVEDEFPLYCS
jgi:hypothetical protein